MARVTQKDRLLKCFQEFGYITSWQAYTELGIMQLATRIFELKKLGYMFKKERVKTLNRWGQEVSFDKYILIGNIYEGAATA